MHTHHGIVAPTSHITMQKLTTILAALATAPTSRVNVSLSTSPTTIEKDKVQAAAAVASLVQPTVRLCSPDFLCVVGALMNSLYTCPGNVFCESSARYVVSLWLS